MEPRTPQNLIRVPVLMKPLCAGFGKNKIENCRQKPEKLVGWQGLEPWTNALKGHCSTN